jgi:hypothetical protein
VGGFARWPVSASGGAFFMASVGSLPKQESFGSTARIDAWWAGPLATFLGLLAFIIYATVTGLSGRNYEIRKNPDFTGAAVAPYLSPMYSPLIFSKESHHAWIHEDRPSWWPGWLGFSSAVLILGGPVLFRFTCYYYRKAYYRAFWLDPPGCDVGEPRKGYLGERYLPLILQNVHRYTLYIATFFLIFLWWDALIALRWPVLDVEGHTTGYTFGMGLGTLIMLVNVVLLSGFTLGCNSLRHLVGGRKNCFSCPMHNGELTTNTAFKAWHFVSRFNERHALWAWLSLFSVGFTDLYIRLCSMGIWSDVRFF